nr:hypothetical protein BgiMline_014923 [Biomphalaria glabrata]
MLGNGFQCLPSMYSKEDIASKKIFLLNDMSSDHVTEKSKEKIGQPHVEYDDDVPASSLSNNRTDDDVKQLVQNMINRPSKNLTASMFGGAVFNACVQSCSALLDSSVTDIHGCHRECLSDPYKYQGTTEKLAQVTVTV